MRVLGLVAASCGGLDTRFRTELAEPAAARGWRLAITLTPTAARWLEYAGELAKLQALTDLEVRSASRLPGQPRPHPDPGVFLFAPGSANSMAKLALGIADNQALTVLGDVLGDPGVTVVVRYQASPSRSRTPGWRAHVAALTACGADVSQLAEPWSTALEALPD
ncbi:flavoprotein [Amycolatopsis acidiphila]|uniref:Flavoprotein n=1 Tax=Amycolatopsis acidiphila TaxID=715473 RepID=A0A558A263_9PSEU|nr:flavoprotein [Amycolatopsis acidiphila]TVT18340.1 flavoprotein [Amycolatopsis acidiphila]UIJ56712.1 flavoprotein [Amycolatopsis acidiphila]GHG55602.1 flavoprotein [Amycolatopsis acidiphila]